MATNNPQDIEQCGVAPAGFFRLQQAVQVEQSAPGAVLIGTAVARPCPIQVCLVHDCQTAVESLQGERDGVEVCQGGQQQAFFGERFGRPGVQLYFFCQSEPTDGRERNDGRGGSAFALRRVDEAHEQSRARRQLRHPYDFSMC